MKTINLKALLLCAVVLLTPVFLSAQYQIYTGQQLDHTYPNVESIIEEDFPLVGNGYAISATTYDAPNTTPLSGEITRTDINGNLIWVNQYLVNGGSLDHRFNNITKSSFTGQLEYLVVGSIVDGGNTTLLAALVDDNGSVLASQEYSSANYNHLLGIKGIVVSDNTFAIVALEADGFNPADTKNIVVMKLDGGLNLVNSMTMSSPSNGRDYDMPTAIIEGPSSDEFFIIGTSNKNTSGGLNNLACAFVASIELPGNVVNWSHNYSTALGGHWDAASDGYYDGNRLWVLANSSIVHYFNLVELNPSTGAVVNEIQYTDSTYGNDFNHYGYKLLPSVSDPEGLAISGWKSIFSTDAVQPFLLEVNENTANINWQWKYNGDNNSQMSLNENNWLYVRAGSQFPYYYNNMMNYRYDREGYVMLSTDNTRNGKEDLFFWYATSSDGEVNPDCGYERPLGDTIVRTFHYNDPVAPVANNINAGMDNFLKEAPIGYENEVCEWQFNKNGPINSTGEKAESSIKVYPNPTNNVLFIDGDGVANVTITDMLGRTLIQKTTYAQAQLTIDVSSLESGMYVVNITTAKGTTQTQRVQIVK